jgi:hypothetical protein
MTVLDHLAQVAAIILILELMVVLLLFLGVAAGLAFGLRWVNHKASSGMGAAQKLADRGSGYVHTGTGYAALPVMVLRKYADTGAAVANAIKQRVRQTEARRSAPTLPPATPSLPSGSTVQPSEPAVGARPVPRL